MEAVKQACAPLKEKYDECTQKLYESVQKSKNTTSLFQCELVFQDYKDCFEIQMAAMIAAKRNKKA